MSLADIAAGEFGANNVGVDCKFANDLRIKILAGCDSREVIDHGRDWRPFCDLKSPTLADWVKCG